jgi:hypothetical protein
MPEIQLTPAQLRANEVAQYQATIDLYTAISASLPSEWPSHLIHLKGATDKHNAIAAIASLTDVALVSDLWAHDDAQAAIRSNTVEMRKAQAILTVLEAQA